MIKLCRYHPESLPYEDGRGCDKRKPRFQGKEFDLRPSCEQRHISLSKKRGTAALSPGLAIGMLDMEAVSNGCFNTVGYAR
jgi:hypothetical protein